MKEKGKLWTDHAAGLKTLRVGWRQMHVRCKCAEVESQESVTERESLVLRS